MESPKDTVTIGHRLVGEGQPVFIIAEIGYNFQTLNQARLAIDLAIGAGADAVKFQTFRAETVTIRSAIFPAEAGGTSQYEEFKQYELSEEAHHELFAYAAQKQVLCFSTPSHYQDVELLEKLRVPAYKIGSDDLTNLPFLDFVARKGKPIILSTGMATLAEVDEAVRTITAAGQRDLILLHCLSNYPVRELGHVNLRALETLRRSFGFPVGFSDHTVGTNVAVAAVALGASLIEKHFTLSKDLPVPDAFFSADPAEFRQMVVSIREVEKALGSGIKAPADSEVDMRRDTRKSIVAASDIPKGTVITEEMIIIKRPAWGIDPKMLPLVLGRTARVDIKEDEHITWDKV